MAAAQSGSERSGDGSAELQESLLQRREDEEREDSHERHPRGQQLMAYQGPFNLQQFILGILFNCGSILVSCFKAVESSCLACLATLGAPVQPRAAPSITQLKLSLIQEERLEQLWASLGNVFQPDAPEHQQELQALWEVAFPGEPCSNLKKNERWKDMGWQGDDPSTDMRGAGLYGVQNLLYMARRYPSEFDRLLHKRTGQRADWEYPFAAAGMNLTFALADLLGMGHAGPPGAARGSVPLERIRKQPTFAGFTLLLSEEPGCFEELYVAAFRLLDARWLDAKASYMQFNAVLKDTMAELGAAIRTRPASLEELNGRALKLPPVPVMRPVEEQQPPRRTAGEPAATQGQGGGGGPDLIDLS